MVTAWADVNGAKGGKKQELSTDVDSYFKITDVSKLVNQAVNEVAETTPDDFKGALAAAVQKTRDIDNSGFSRKSEFACPRLRQRPVQGSSVVC